jgi:hypothetical protein
VKNLTHPLELRHLKILATNMIERIIFLNATEPFMKDPDPNIRPNLRANPNACRVFDPNGELVKYNDTNIIYKINQLRDDMQTFLSDDYIDETVAEFEAKVLASGQKLGMHCKFSVRYAHSTYRGIVGIVRSCRYMISSASDSDSLSKLYLVRN